VVAFRGRVRQWRNNKPGGLAVVDVPPHLVAELGGRRQTRVTGNLNGAAFTGSTMLVAGVGVSKAALKAAQATVGDEVRLDLRPGKE
jgi:NaMN:DMB phosphoribosyltransferase